jgi:RNA polymerase sigma-70 factor (ECF subfamily)
VGPYLPEPVVVDVSEGSPGSDPADAAELADSLTYAFLVLLDELSPVERAVVLLHDVFAYPFDEVAEVVGRSAPAVRQIASRSRRKLDAGGVGARPAAPPALVQETLGRVLVAVATGDIEGLMAVLAPDVVELSDGGAAKRAGRRPIVGADRVARLMVNLAKRSPHLSVRFVQVNARPGLLFTDGDEPEMVMTFDLDEQGRVARIFSQLNPDKLAHLRHP